MWVVTTVWLLTFIAYLFGQDSWPVIAVNIFCLGYIFLTPAFYKYKSERLKK